MKQVSTKTDVLLSRAFATSVAFYLCVANDLFILSCILLVTLTVLSYLAVLSHMPLKAQSKGKLFLLTFCCAVTIILFFSGVYLGYVEKCGLLEHKETTS
jgi:hypothetical protein